MISTPQQILLGLSHQEKLYKLYITPHMLEKKSACRFSAGKSEGKAPL